MNRTQFAIAIPQLFDDGAFEPASFRAYLARAEALGYASAWTQEQTLGTMPMLGPIESMTFAAACTERLRLGCVVFVTPLNSPVHLAKSLSTLDQLSRGRLEVGVGTGGPGRPFSAFGVDPASYVARFVESLRLMQALWTDNSVNFQGRFWQLENAAMEPKPLQKPHPPIWFGANAPAALRRAVRYGDGFFGAGSTTTARFAEQVSIVRQALGEAGRDPATFRIAKRIYVAIDDNMERARERVRDGLQRLYSSFGMRDLLDVAVYGPPTACIDGVRAAVNAGAELILFTPFFDDGDQMERLAHEVTPQFEPVGTA